METINMSKWITIEDPDDVELNEDNEIDILYDYDHQGNSYISVPIEYVLKALEGKYNIEPKQK